MFFIQTEFEYTKICTTHPPTPALVLYYVVVFNDIKYKISTLGSHQSRVEDAFFPVTSKRAWMSTITFVDICSHQVCLAKVLVTTEGLSSKR